MTLAIFIILIILGITVYDIWLWMQPNLPTISEWWWEHGKKWMDYLILIIPNTLIFIFCGFWAGLLWLGGGICWHFSDKRPFGKN